ncbi:MAG: asparagine--tRNA ligase [Acidobacteriota bacterium]
MKMDLLKDIYNDFKSYIGKTAEISGWVRSLRVSKNFGFIVLYDGTHFKTIQIVFEDNLKNFGELSKVTIGSSLKVTGTIVESPGANQDFELKASSVEVLNIADQDFPIQKKRHTLEFLRTIAHLRPRTNTFAAVFRIRSLLAFAIHKFFVEKGFVYIHTPIITGSDAEGAGEMFKVTTLDLLNTPLDDEKKIDYSKDFFGKEANLTVSGQLAVENFCWAYRNVYTFGPTFRAENSNTQRHASEFWMIEPEMAFADINENMNIAQEMIKSIFSYILENAPEEMAFFEKFIEPGVIDKVTRIVESEFMRITYTEAIEILEKSGEKFDFPVKWGIDLQTEHERYLTEKHFSAPVFVIDYPKEIKAFYMKMNKDNKTVAAMDLLVPGVGEIIGGSQREEDHAALKKRIDDMGLNEEDYWWYLDLRRFGSVVHSGFGLGFERLIMYLTGMKNIRDVIPFPRTPNNAEF